MDLSELYRNAALAAHADGIDAGNEDQLLTWIRENCGYKVDNEFFILLGIGSALADIQSQERGHNNSVDEAFYLAKHRVSEKGGKP